MLIIILLIIIINDFYINSVIFEWHFQYKLKNACPVVSTLNQIDVFLSVLQKYLNQKRKTSNQQAKHSNCWGPPPQKISNPSQSDD